MKENNTNKKFIALGVTFAVVAMINMIMLGTTVIKLKATERKLDKVSCELTETNFDLEEMSNSYEYVNSKLEAILNTDECWSMSDNGSYCYHYDKEEKVIKIKKIKKK